MITKVSCYNQNFNAAGLASSRTCATGARIASNQIGRAASRINQQHRHAFLSDEACAGSCVGFVLAVVAAITTKSVGWSYFCMHAGGMIGGFLGGKKYELYRNTIR